MISLPVDAALPELIDSLGKKRNLVFQATPGSGKTTRVPPALLRSSFRQPQQEILVLEPRRLAAKWAARRVAEEMNEAVGQTVGYQFRLEKVESPSTRLRFYTEGMLMRRLLSDPMLSRAACVILDEFHERHLQGDLALSYLRWLQLNRRPDLRLVVMSATLDSQALQQYLGGEQECSLLNLDQKMFPVDVQYLETAESPSLRLENAVLQKIREICGGRAHVQSPASKKGDILVFLPGMGEIRRCQQLLEEASLGERLRILPLHGDLSREEQDEVMKPQILRKVILSTNVAETSLTIDGVTHVVDSGLHRQASYSWWSGVPALKTRSISRASAIQRAGRAGRTAPGTCHRLYTKGDFEGRILFEKPEIQRADLAQAVLELKALGVKDVGEFPWFERPQSASLATAETLLFRLGMLEEEKGGKLTDAGKAMASIPAHPRVSKLLWEGKSRGVLKESAHLGALISEDELQGVDALEQAFKMDRLGFLSKQAETQFLRLGEGLPVQAQTSAKKNQEVALSKAVLFALPDRVAWAKEKELLLCAGGSALWAQPNSHFIEKPVVVLSIQETQFSDQLKGKIKVRSICPISEEDLFDVTPKGVDERVEIYWDEKSARLWRSEKLCYGELTLSEKKAPLSKSSLLSEADQLLAIKAFLKSTLRVDINKVHEMSVHDWIRVLEGQTDPIQLESTWARLALWAKYSGEKSKEEPIGNFWRLIQPIVVSLVSESDLREVNWNEALVHSFFSERPELLSQLERELPTQFQLASGRRVKINYSLQQAPWIESRLQDFFGMTKSPTVMKGRLALTMHLLAPNGRAVQVTSDLEGFWQRNYPALRSELGRRYPRHAWPENPLIAIPAKPARPR